MGTARAKTCCPLSAQHALIVHFMALPPCRALPCYTKVLRQKQRLGRQARLINSDTNTRGNT